MPDGMVHPAGGMPAAEHLVASGGGREEPLAVAMGTASTIAGRWRAEAGWGRRCRLLAGTARAGDGRPRTVAMAEEEASAEVRDAWPHTICGSEGASSGSASELGSIEADSYGAAPSPPGSSEGSFVSLRSALRRIEFHRFLIALSVRPGKHLAISDQRVPWVWTASTIALSSSSDHIFLLTSGDRWLCQRSRHCFPDRPSMAVPMADQRTFPPS
mmetsp:Transcript_46970/g.93595  ORF Transcript_46970/g.93595 Transcript_46970/m.93595 type:complete len:215 (+) Transcript_46970:1362-2006(+)